MLDDLRLIDGLGLWLEHSPILCRKNGPALFLDRDGVIVEETRYLGHPEDMRLVDGSANAIAAANRDGIPVIVVTNQAGIGRNYYSWDGFAAVQQALAESLAARNAHMDMVLACAFHGKGVSPFNQVNHYWRKPNPGMIEIATERLGIDVGRSVIVGDKLSDLEAGKRAGLGLGVLVRTGHGKREAKEFDEAALAPMRAIVADSLATTWPAISVYLATPPVTSATDGDR